MGQVPPTSDRLKILFMGSPEIAVPSLAGLVKSNDPVIGVVAQPDRPAGRGQNVQSCAVAFFARQHDLPLLQPEKISADWVKKLAALAPDLIVLVAYGKILPKAILDLPSQQCINLHFSLLPKYRGAAPVQWSLIQGEFETGVSTLFMTEKLDAGPILRQKKLPIEPDDTLEILSHRLANAGAQLLLETIELLKNNNLNPVPQDEREATFAPSLHKEDGKINFAQKAQSIVNRLRGVTPWPGGYTFLNGKLLKVHSASVVPRKATKAPGEIVDLGPLGIEVACGQESLLLEEVQLEGKKRMSAVEFLKGHRLEIGMKLG